MIKSKMQSKTKIRLGKRETFNRAGFTLVEILLVIAIIGILAAVIFITIGRSDTANLRATQQTAKSIMPFVQECYFHRKPLKNPVPGDDICEGSTSQWPDLSVDVCSYNMVDAENGEFDVECVNIGSVQCKVSLGGCEIVEAP